MTQENLQICKLMILYMLGRVDFLLTRSQISDFILGREFMDYLTFSQAENELRETGLVDISSEQAGIGKTYLFITPEGRQTLTFFGNRLSESIRAEIEDYFKENAYELRDELAIYGNYQKVSSGDYEAHLVAKDRDVPLVDIRLTVPTEDIAEHICDSWRDKSTEIYQFLTEQLF